MAKNESGIMDVIRCDEPSYLIWKWHPNNTNEGDTAREDFVRWGSPLRVKDGEVAVFVYNSKKESVQEFIEGPADCILDTANLPIISNIVGLAYGGGTPFQAEVFFINLAQIIQQKFVVPYFDVYDHRFTDFGVPVAVRGTITFKISDYENFIKLHRLQTFDLDRFYDEVKDAVSRFVKTTVSNASDDYDIPVIQLERRIDDINGIVENRIKTRFYEEFGVTVSNIDIGAIDIDKTSEGYQELKAVTQDLTTSAMKAQNEVSIKEMKANQTLSVFEKAGKIFTNFKEDAYAKHRMAKKGKYEISGESIIKKVGEINIPGLKSKKDNSSSPQTTPPPIPTLNYYIAVNGQPEGPYGIDKLSEMKKDGLLTAESLVWKEGMDNWQAAGDNDDLKSLFPKIPPIPKI